MVGRVGRVRLRATVQVGPHVEPEGGRSKAGGPGGVISRPEGAEEPGPPLRIPAHLETTLPPAAALPPPPHPISSTCHRLPPPHTPHLETHSLSTLPLLSLKGTRRMKVDSVPDTASHRWSQVAPRA